MIYRLREREPGKKMWFVDAYHVDIKDVISRKVPFSEISGYEADGDFYITFDKKKIYNVWRDYPLQYDK